MRELHWTRSESYLDQRAVSTDVNLKCFNLQEIKLKAANEALGTRFKHKNNRGLKHMERRHAY
jgi:hypothetical protein